MGNWMLVRGTGTGSTSTKTFRNAVGYPVLYSNVLYGTKNNPFYSITYNQQISQSSWSIYYDASNSVSTIFGSIEPSWSQSTFYFSTPVTSTLSEYYCTIYDSVNISGKYRLRDTAAGFNACTFVPVNFALNGTNYNFIGNHNNYNRADPTSVSYYMCIGLIGSDGVTGIQQLQSGSSVITDTYRNSIIDFGNTPQEIPTFLYDWLNNNTDPIYPYTFTVKTQNGVDVLTSLEEAPAMADVTPYAIGNVKTLTMTGVNGRTYTMTWESETPAGKQFLGLAYGANETRASVPVGRTTPVNWDGSLTIYEAYGTYRPPVTTFDINLYQSSAEVNRVDKTNFLTGVGTLSGVLREECSIIAPSITFKQTTVPTFNYVYIAAFGRYYYVTGITSVSKDVWRMSLSCDVLMTWKDDIRALTAIIARQENSFNPLLLDSELPAQANQNVTVTEFPAGGFSTAGAIAHPFLLTVVGA